MFCHPLWSDLLHDFGPSEQTTCLARDDLLMPSQAKPPSAFSLNLLISFGDPQIKISLRDHSLGTFPVNNNNCGTLLHGEWIHWEEESLDLRCIFRHVLLIFLASQEECQPRWFRWFLTLATNSLCRLFPLAEIALESACGSLITRPPSGMDKDRPARRWDSLKPRQSQSALNCRGAAFVSSLPPSSLVLSRVTHVSRTDHVLVVGLLCFAYSDNVRLPTVIHWRSSMTPSLGVKLSKLYVWFYPFLDPW